MDCHSPKKWGERALSHCTKDDPEKEHGEPHDEPHGAQNDRQIVVLLHRLQVTSLLVVLRVDSDEDGGDGAEQPDPAGAPEHDARGDDGVHEPVVVGPVAASVDGGLHDLRLLLYHHYIAGGGCRSLWRWRLVVRRRSLYRSRAEAEAGRPAGAGSRRLGDRLAGAGSRRQGDKLAVEGSRPAGEDTLEGSLPSLTGTRALFCHRFSSELRLPGEGHTHKISVRTEEGEPGNEASRSVHTNPHQPPNQSTRQEATMPYTRPWSLVP